MTDSSTALVLAESKRDTKTDEPSTAVVLQQQQSNNPSPGVKLMDATQLSGRITQLLAGEKEDSNRQLRTFFAYWQPNFHILPARLCRKSRRQRTTYRTANGPTLKMVTRTTFKLPISNQPI